MPSLPPAQKLTESARGRQRARRYNLRYYDGEPPTHG
jgi:hypothetical protein